MEVYIKMVMVPFKVKIINEFILEIINKQMGIN